MPQECRDELSGVPVEDQERVEDALLVVAVVVGTFLIAVRGIVCCVEVQKDARRRTVLAPLSHIEFAQRFGHAQAGSGVGGVLKTGDGGLACQVPVRLRQSLPHTNFKSGSLLSASESSWSS